MNAEITSGGRETRLSPPRLQEFERVTALTGNTPLVKVARISIPGGNQIYAKAEWQNPTGSIFDRLYPEAIRVREEEGLTVPGRTTLTEASTGNAGAAFAWACQQLGYKAVVFIHEDAPPARIKQIRSYGAEVILTPKGQYAKGYVQAQEQYLTEAGRMFRDEDGDLRMKVHNADLPFPITKIKSRQATGYHRLADEAYEQVRNMEGEDARFDIAIMAVGSGTSSKDIGRRLKEINPDIRIIGTEPQEAPTATYLRSGQVLDFDEMPHQMFGSGAFGLPAVKLNIDFGVLNEIRVVGKDAWEPILEKLHQEEGHPVGYTGAGNVAVALQIAQEVEGKRIFTLYADHIGKYGDDYVPQSFKGVIV